MALKRAVNASLFARARRRLHAEILRALGGCRTVADVTAGDDHFFLALGAQSAVDRILLNDLDFWALQRGRSAYPKVLWICADALTLSFLRYRFDGTLLKNVLHHLADQQAIRQLLRTAGDIARRVVIVEIEDPRHAGRVSRLLHRLYYRRLLGEQDNESLFLPHDRLRAVLRDAYPGAELVFSRIPTVRGTYTLCRVGCPDEGGRGAR